MKLFKVIKISENWSTSRLTKNVEKILAEKSNEGWEVVSVAFGINVWLMITAFITISKEKIEQ
jgi:glycerol uptake facilitator-like aquaporin